MPITKYWIINRPGYEHEFAEISKFIIENKMKNVYFVTADVHFADIIQYDPDHNGTIDYRELVPLQERSIYFLAPESDGAVFRLHSNIVVSSLRWRNDLSLSEKNDQRFQMGH